MTRRRFDLMLLALVLIALTLYAIAAANPTVLILGAAGVLFGRTLGWAMGKRAAIPTPLSIALVVAVSALTGLRVLNTGFNVELFSEFIVMLLAVKMLDRRRSRDDAQVITLAVFLAIGGVLTNNSIWVGALALVMIPVLAFVVLGHQFLAVRERGTPGTTGRGAHRSDARRLAWAITATALLGSTALFIVLPRGIGQQAFGSWGDVGSGAVVGFDDSIELGNAGLLSDSSTPVLDVQFLGDTGSSLGERGRVFYLRGAVLNEYNNGAWNVTLQEFPRTAYHPGYSIEEADPVAKFEPRGSLSWDVEQRITLRNAPRETSALFTLLDPLHVAFAQYTTWQYDPQTHTTRRSSPSGKFRYTMWSRDRALENLRSPRFRAERGGMSRNAEEFRARAIDTLGIEGEGTTTESRIHALATQVLENAGIEPDPDARPVTDDVAAARAIESFLGTSGGFSYTLAPGRPPRGEDPTIWFLHDSKAGHCEYFASAMTTMCWSVGIPARVITGYVASEYNELTDHYVVRESNAHAWVEVRIARDGQTRYAGQDAEIWRTFDPTPRTDFLTLHQKPDSMFAGLRRAFEAIEFAWVTNVVGYNTDSQQSFMGRPVFEWLQRADERAGDRLRIAGPWLYLRAVLVGVTVWAVSAVVGYLLFGRLFLDIRRRIRLAAMRLFSFGWLRGGPRAGGPREALARHKGHAAAYLALVSLLERAGHPKPDSVPLGAHAESLADPGLSLPQEVLDLARRVSESVYAVVYAGRTPAPELDAIMRRAARTLRSARPKAR